MAALRASALWPIACRRGSRAGPRPVRAISSSLGPTERQDQARRSEEPLPLPDGPQLPWREALPLVGPMIRSARLAREADAFYRGMLEFGGVARTSVLGRSATIVSDAAFIRDLVAKEDRPGGAIKSSWPPAMVELMGKNSVLFQDPGPLHDGLRRAMAPVRMCMLHVHA